MGGRQAGRHIKIIVLLLLLLHCDEPVFTLIEWLLNRERQYPTHLSFNEIVIFAENLNPHITPATVPKIYQDKTGQDIRIMLTNQHH